MHASSRGAGTLGAFLLVGMAALAMMFASVIVTAGVTSKWSAQAAGDALMWMGAGHLVAVAGGVAAYRALARRWAGATPAWWSQALLGVLVLGAAAVLFLFAMVLMNR
jgi:hypothetical protein